MSCLVRSTQDNYYTSRATGAERARQIKIFVLIFLKMVRSAVFKISLITVSSSSPSRPTDACGTSSCCPSPAASNETRHHPPPFRFPGRRDLQRRGNPCPGTRRSVRGAESASAEKDGAAVAAQDRNSETDVLSRGTDALGYGAAAGKELDC